MRTGRSAYTFEPSGAQGELMRLVRRIQALTVELEELRRSPGAAREVETTERARAAPLAIGDPSPPHRN